MATRLTEEEVHIACAEIATQGERPTSLNLLDKLGRGSLTTITKYLNSWNTTDDALAIDAESLPAVVQLPSELSKEGEDLLKKMWAFAKNITDNELEIQREALKQAEIANQQKVEEAFKFSEAQALKTERLEEDLTTLNIQLDDELNSHKTTTGLLNDAEKTNVGLTKDNEQLQNEILELKNQLLALEEANEAANKNKKLLQKSHEKEIKVKDGEIRSLEIKNGQIDEKLNSSATINNKLTSDLNDKTKELSSRIIQIEKINVHLETSANELKTMKGELKEANKRALNSEKLVAKMEGKLEVYKTLDK
jgi:DNA repair exonuclease SbcCD ATPase subunit